MPYFLLVNHKKYQNNAVMFVVAMGQTVEKFKCLSGHVDLLVQCLKSMRGHVAAAQDVLCVQLHVDVTETQDNEMPPAEDIKIHQDALQISQKPKSTKALCLDSEMTQSWRQSERRRRKL